VFKVSDFEREICGDFQLGFEYEEDEKDNLSITSFTFNIVLWDEK
jgi:hypothetical protein